MPNLQNLSKAQLVAIIEAVSNADDTEPAREAAKPPAKKSGGGNEKKGCVTCGKPKYPGGRLYCAGCKAAKDAKETADKKVKEDDRERTKTAASKKKEENRKTDVKTKRAAQEDDDDSRFDVIKAFIEEMTPKTSARSSATAPAPAASKKSDVKLCVGCGKNPKAKGAVKYCAACQQEKGTTKSLR